MARLQFWYDFGSTYSYLSAMQIEKLAKAADVEIVWRPFLLGPIFKAQGWTSSPFNLFPAKGRYMVRDIERLAQERGLRFALPTPFPANSLLAARVALTEEVADRCMGAFARAVFHAEFADNRDISSPETIGDVLAQLGLDGAAPIEKAKTEAVKDALKTRTAQAQDLGVFGAPTFITEDGELFWGDNRLPQALAWARRSQ